MISMKNLAFATFFVAGIATNLNAMDHQAPYTQDQAPYTQDVAELSSEQRKILEYLKEEKIIESYLVIIRIASLGSITAAVSTIRKVIKKEHFNITQFGSISLFHQIPNIPYNPKTAMPIAQAFLEIAGADAKDFILKPYLNGYSPLDLARIWNNTEIVELFEEAINTNN